MSDNVLRLIPADPRFVPRPDAARDAAAIVWRALPAADVVEVETYAAPVFIDQGANLEALICPACHRRLDFYGPEASLSHLWWSAIIDPLQGQNVADYVTKMPCCGGSVPFPDLEFEWPAGVASFEISVRNPGVARPLDTALLGQLERVLDCRVREIWAHY